MNGKIFIFTNRVKINKLKQNQFVALGVHSVALHDTLSLCMGNTGFEFE